MAKPAKPAEKQAETGEQAPKSKKMLIIIIAAVVLLLVIGGGAAFFLMKPSHPAKHQQSAEQDNTDSPEEDANNPPTFIDVGTFTANLMHEEGDRYLQVGITLKLSKDKLEEKVKSRSPEIQNAINMLLQSKYPSQLATVEGKVRLANEIKAQVEYVLGLRKTAPPIHSILPGSPPAPPDKTQSRKGISAVLFTTFIIQ
ncbi:MAG: flagellar basal body-associated FliL family protein [Gallionella sp.]